MNVQSLSRVEQFNKRISAQGSLTNFLHSFQLHLMVFISRCGTQSTQSEQSHVMAGGLWWMISSVPAWGVVRVVGAVMSWLCHRPPSLLFKAQSCLKGCGSRDLKLLEISANSSWLDLHVQNDLNVLMIAKVAWSQINHLLDKKGIVVWKFRKS